MQIRLIDTTSTSDHDGVIKTKFTFLPKARKTECTHRHTHTHTPTVSRHQTTSTKGELPLRAEEKQQKELCYFFSSLPGEFSDQDAVRGNHTEPGGLTEWRKEIGV